MAYQGYIILSKLVRDLPPDLKNMVIIAEAIKDLQKNEGDINVIDMHILATLLQNELNIIVTRNEHHFDMIKRRSEKDY